VIEKLKGIFNFFRFKDENEAIIVGLAGSEEIFGEAIDVILKRNKEKIKQNH